MIIDDELQKVVLEQDSSTKKKLNADLPKTSAEFADLFSQALVEDTAKNTKASPLSKSILSDNDTEYRELSAVNYATMNNVILGTSDKDADSMNDLEEEIYSITAMLDGLDAYAEKLTSSNSNKAAWEDLQKISGQLASLQQKNNLPQGLNALVDEIDVLATTEKFKMNRGDYLL